MSQTVNRAADKAKRLCRARARRLITAEAPDYEQQNAALGLLDAARTQEIKDAISARRDACNATEAAIDDVIASDKTDESKITEIQALAS